MRRPGRSDAVRANARAAGSFVLWAATAVGLTIAVGVLDREALTELSDRIGDDLPRLLLAAVTVMVSWAVAVAVAAAVGQSALRATGVRQPTTERVLRLGILAAGAALALAQLGVDPVLVGVVLVVVAGAPALAAALLTAWGGREVAAQLAAGRALRAQLREGWHLRVAGPVAVEGRIVALHPTSVEVLTGHGDRVHVPNAALLDHAYSTHP
jgi:hypothetical protein